MKSCLFPALLEKQHGGRKGPNGLQHDTDLRQIEVLATLKNEEISRLERLKEDLSKNPAKAVAEQALRADNIKRLIEAVNLVEGKTTDKALADFASAVQNARSKRKAADMAADKAFSGEPLEGVGGEVWRALWDSARRYSTEIAFPRQTFRR